MKKILFKSADGLNLIGDFYQGRKQDFSVLLVHGITANRNEEGLYSMICEQLKSKNISSFTFDLRAHGESDGLQENLTLSGCINDIYSATQKLFKISNCKKIVLIACSFSGGLSINVAERLDSKISSMILLNPRLDYTPWATNHPFWKENKISKKGTEQLNSKGFIIRNDFKIGRCLFNELLGFKPAMNLQSLSIPILFIHGTEDSIVPIKESEDRFNENGRGKLIRIKNADHGFVSVDDEEPSNPTNIKFREEVISHIMKWIDENN